MGGVFRAGGEVFRTGGEVFRTGGEEYSGQVERSIQDG